MHYLLAQHAGCNKNLIIEHEQNEASWPAIVDLIFDVIAHRDRLALKRRALGRRKRKLARRSRRFRGRR